MKVSAREIVEGRGRTEEGTRNELGRFSRDQIKQHLLNYILGLVFS